MSHPIRDNWLLILFVAALGLLPGMAAACGGFFCMAMPIDQSAERIIFTVNGDGTITAIVGINYTGAAEDFSWVVPVPSPPELDVADTQSLNALQLATDVQFSQPDRYCDDLFFYAGRGGGGGDGGLFIEEGHVGPYDYAIIGSEDPNEMIAWLRDNSYRITPEMEPLIALYVEEDMYFLAMRLSQDAEVGDIQPVMMTYESDEPMIPIRLTAVAAVPNMPIITWIFGDARYVADNYVNATPDFSGFQAPSQVQGIGKYSYGFDFIVDDFGNYTSGDVLRYQREQRRIQERFDGLAFITEYAAPTSQLPEALRQDSLLAVLQDEYVYVTRLRAQMSPEQMTVDPMFSPAPNAPDVSNIIELNDHVDPLHYWGCSSRTALSERTIANLPDGRTRLDALQLDIAHPADWQLSEFSIANDPVRVFAPEAVDSGTIEAAFRGEAIPPMFVIVETDAGELMSNVSWVVAQHLKKPDEVRWPGEETNYPYGYFFDYRARPFQDEFESNGVAFAVLANDEDWQHERDIYFAMLEYATSYQYYLRDDLPHTLMLAHYGDERPYSSPVFFSYPDGWVEHLNDDQTISVMPDEVDDDAAPQARLLDVFAPQLTAVEQLADYNLSEESVQAIEEAEESGCNPTLPAVPFEQDGRMGYVRYDEGYIIEASVAVGAFADYDADLRAIAESMTFPLSGCG